MGFFRSLGGALFVVFGLHDFDTAHGANGLLVGTGLAIVSGRLVDFGLTDLALLEGLRVGVVATLLGREQLVFAHGPTS